MDPSGAEDLAACLSGLSLNETQEENPSSQQSEPKAVVNTTSENGDSDAECAEGGATVKESEPEKNYKMYGKFKCPRCGRKWTSVHSWCSKGQVCAECSTVYQDVYVLPYNLIRREVSTGGGGGGGAHQRSNCQMFQDLGRNCTKLNTVVKQKK